MKASLLFLGIFTLPLIATASNKTPKLNWGVQIIDLETGKESKFDIDTKAGKLEKIFDKYGFTCTYTEPTNQNSNKAIAMKRVLSCFKEGEKYKYSSASVCAAVKGGLPANSAANIIISEDKDSKGFSLSMVCYLEN